MLSKQTSYVLVFAIVVLLCAPSVALVQATPKDKGSTISIHGASYTLVDRFDFVGYPPEFRPGGEVKADEPRRDACSDSDSPPTEPSVPWLLRIPDAKSSGFSVTLLNLRLFKHLVHGPQFERGTLEIAVFNPCREPIAVPVVPHDLLKQELFKDDSSPNSSVDINALAFFSRTLVNDENRFCSAALRLAPTPTGMRAIGSWDRMKLLCISCIFKLRLLPCRGKLSYALPAT